MASSLSSPPEDAADPWTDDPAAPLIEQIQGGIDVEHNFERLYKLFHPRLIRYFSSRGFEAALCEEITQDVFLRVFKSIGSFERRSRFARWLFEIAHSLYANELRRIHAVKREGLEMPLHEETDPDAGDRKAAPALASPAPGPEEEARRHEESAALRDALETLPPQMRQCVYLRLDQGLKYREVAAVMQVSIDTVKAQLGNAKARLRRLLADDGAALTGGDEGDS